MKACETCNWNSTPCHWFQSILKVTQDGITSGWKQKSDLRRPKKHMTFRTTPQILESVKHFSYLPFQKIEWAHWCTQTTRCSQQRWILIQDSIPSDSNRASFQAPARAAAFTSSERRSGEWWWRRREWLPSTGVMSCETKNEQFHIETSQIGNAKDWNLPSIPFGPWKYFSINFTMFRINDCLHWNLYIQYISTLCIQTIQFRCKLNTLKLHSLRATTNQHHWHHLRLHRFRLGRPAPEQPQSPVKWVNEQNIENICTEIAESHIIIQYIVQ